MAINVEMPLHKAREMMAPYRQQMPINNPLPVVDNEPPEAPNVLVDAVSLGGPSGAKPLLRHVLVKDLNKIMSRMKLEHPKTGVFTNKAPMGLYALFDGQSCAGEPGPMAAEFCARNFHTKLMRRLADLEAAEERAIEAALVGTFDDLEQDLINNQPDVHDGCGAAVALLIGDVLFTATVGLCCALLCRTSGEKTSSPVRLSGPQGIVEADGTRIRFGGGVLQGDGGVVRIRHPSGQLSTVSRSLGNRYWKDTRVTGMKSPLIMCVPDVKTFALKASDEHPFLLLAASTVVTTLTPQQLVDVGGEYEQQPRAACGEIATRAMAARAGAVQCTALEVCFLPARQEGKKRAAGASGPEAKKAKTASAARGGGTVSMRLRHILVKFQDAAPKDGKKIAPNRQEAEASLRQVLCDLRSDLKASKKAPKDATELVTMTSKKFGELCRQKSECPTAKKGGQMCGDLGWLSPEDLANMGAGFKEIVEVLLPGQFSDIVATEQGLHIVQRVA